MNLEVDVSHEGYVPVLYQVLPGNTADITRPLPHLRALLRFLARPELAERRWRPILVSDCKMVTPEAVLACHRHDLFYLGPLSHGTATDVIVRTLVQRGEGVLISCLSRVAGISSHKQSQVSTAFVQVIAAPSE